MKTATLTLGAGVLLMALSGIAVLGTTLGMVGLLVTMVGGFGMAIALEDQDLMAELRATTRDEQGRTRSSLV